MPSKYMIHLIEKSKESNPGDPYCQLVVVLFKTHMENKKAQPWEMLSENALILL